MHYVYFVKIKKEDAITNRDAICAAQTLLDQNYFATADGYWSGGKCDSYVVGGDWSGAFSELALNINFKEEVYKLLHPNGNDSASVAAVTRTECEPYAEQIQNLWLTLGGKNTNPFVRSGYNPHGAEDDAIILTTELIDALKIKYRESAYFDEDFGEKNVSELSLNDSGHWFVIVDCHV